MEAESNSRWESKAKEAAERAIRVEALRDATHHVVAMA